MEIKGYVNAGTYTLDLLGDSNNNSCFFHSVVVR